MQLIVEQSVTMITYKVAKIAKLTHARWGMH